ncbi:monovalent cation/H+ antiporter subunit D [Thiomicrospira pelophila]|uniref:monovalent cation/H+ antiporter subunit D n=1 Tax=Thiomicrospira pelophila TaxID=934 RepID=UPI0004A6CA1A|nr:monovalent cation/H+ antiporter subunit D [Thiomicrospira pelophila]
MMQLTAWAVLLPLIAGFVLLFARMGGLRLQRSLNLLVVLGLVFMSIEMVKLSLTGVHQVYLAGNWIAPFGIVFVLDQLSALMVLITSLLALGALWYAIATKYDKQGSHFHVLFQLQLFGLNGAFLTGDVFNLFVFFEVLLLASYGLLLHGGGRLRTKAGLHYVVINLIGSTLFLFAVGALYGAVGTLNIADMAAKISVAPAEDLGLIAAAGLLLLVVFGVKAAMFPLYLWLPNAYAQTSAPVAALFAIMTKVGIYSIIRVHGTIFGEQAGDLASFYTPWVLGLGLITLLLAAFGVMAARGLREQVAYLVLASVATLLIGVGLNSPQALAATLYYLIHSTLIAGGMFLLADIISRGRGVHEDRFEPAPIIPNAILIGSVFMFGAVAMTGMPPLSGFFGKVLILAAALENSWFFAILAVVLVASLLMIIAMARAGSLLFYRTQPVDVLPGEPLNVAALGAVIGLLAISPILVIFANPVTAYTELVSIQVFDNATYIEAVLSTPATQRVE